MWRSPVMSSDWTSGFFKCKLCAVWSALSTSLPDKTEGWLCPDSLGRVGLVELPKSKR